ELEKFGLADAPLNIQDHFIHRWYHLQKQNIDIEAWQKAGDYEIRYIFKREGQTAAFKYWVNGQNVFKNNFQKLPTQTNSDELFETIVKILEDTTPVIVNRNNAGGILTQFEFDAAIEEEKPFLKNLFDHVSKGLSDDEIITKIQHLEYRERYTIEKNGRSCVIDFEYDNSGFFGRVLPLEKKCDCPKLQAKIRSIVNNLKKADHVI
ncbi:MAG: hypothetical protein GX999_09170, partial [Bacteroidales bacterium]|nr:hypothetical protein [Bacteroidales bacterium]